jgi:hypothetical protein
MLQVTSAVKTLSISRNRMDHITLNNEIDNHLNNKIMKTSM